MEETRELRFAKAITSLTAVMVPMIIIILGLAITGAHLIYHSFPVNMDEWQKIPGAVFLGIALALAFLTVLGNKDLLVVLKDSREWSVIVVVLAIFDAFLLMIFFEVFEKWDQLASFELVRKIFISCLISFLVFIFVTIFIQKKKQSTQEVKHETKIRNLLATNKQLETTNNQFNDKLKQYRKDSEQLKKLLPQITCRYCKEVKSVGSIKSHESRCEKRK